MFISRARTWVNIVKSDRGQSLSLFFVYFFGALSGMESDRFQTVPMQERGFGGVRIEVQASLCRDDVFSSK